MAGIGFGDGKQKKGRRKASPKKSELLPRELRYTKERKLGASMRKAALKAGYPLSMANKAGDKIESRPAVAAELDRWSRLVDVAVPDWLIAQRLKEGTEATVTKIATFGGRITDAREFVDFAERRQHIELAAEFKGRIQRHGSGAHAEINMPITLISTIPRPPRDGNGQDKVGS